MAGSDKRSFLFLIPAIPFTLCLAAYYYTGAGGPLRLAVVMVPYAFALHVLDSLRTGGLYPRLGRRLNLAIAVVYLALCAVVATYLFVEFWDLNIARFGAYNRYDLIVGAIALFLIMEYSRRRHFAIFVLNVFLIVYAIYGRILPGVFSHPGLPVEMVMTAMSVQFATGVFGRLAQIALTLIGAFVLLVSVAQGFGCVRSIVKAAMNVSARSVRAIPESAVLGSMAVATVSGSGAANAAATGSITIPLMKSIGLRDKIAAAVETAASIGGQLMPPMMGVSAFIMADFLGVSYFDVIARGFIPALVYYVGIAVAVYLLSYRYLSPKLKPKVAPGAYGSLETRDKINVVTFLSGLALLIYLMGVVKMAAIYAALLTAIVIFVPLLITTFYYGGRSSPSAIRGLKAVANSLAQVVERFASLTSDLTLLLATLGITTGAFVITGVPTKIGWLLMEVAKDNMLLMLAITLAFGYFVGLGLPPSATYIITAIAIIPYMIEMGVSPWVAHFYAFFIGVFSELSPPTSVAAAVASRIANASFMRTMFEALKICLPLYILMFAVFARPEIVVEPGLEQLAAGALVMAGTVGAVFGIQGRFSKRVAADAPLRLLLCLLASVVLFHPNERLATLALAPMLGLTAFGFYRMRRLGV